MDAGLFFTVTELAFEEPYVLNRGREIPDLLFSFLCLSSEPRLLMDGPTCINITVCSATQSDVRRAGVFGSWIHETRSLLINRE